MNTIISLCHFCEIHGSAVLFCTQEIFMPKCNNEDEEEMFLSCYLTPPPCSTSEIVKSTKSSKKCKSNETCEACQSFKNATPGFLSRDETSSKVYLSTQCPYEETVHKIVRQTCNQSISCEQCPGQVGPMFFGDDGGSYTFSFKFSLKDFHSRGFKRSYSINVISKDKIYLLASWECFANNLENIVTQLKNDAEDVFNVEHAQHGSNVSCKSLPISSSSSVSVLHQKNVRLQKGHGKQTRSLCDITGNSDVFSSLHQSFVWLMKTNAERLTENIAMKNHNNLIDLNKLEETEEGFVKLYSVPMRNQDEIDNTCGNGDESVSVFTHLRSLMKVLGLPTFIEVLYHVIIGTQILIRAQDKQVIRSVINCLKVLLPEGCRSITYHTTDYKNSMHCNFVGMPLLPLLPPNLKPCLLLDISGVHTLKKIPPIDKCRIYECLRPEIEELLLRYYMVTFEKVNLPTKIPTILENIQKIILNECLDNSVVDLCLASLKEDWFNKAKTYYTYTKTGQRSKNDLERLLLVLGARNEDKIVLTFWMTAMFPRENQPEQFVF